MKKNKLLTILRYLSGSLLPMLFWLLLSFGFDKPYIAILTICSAAVHELGHIIATLASQVGVRGLNSKLNGLKIEISGQVDYGKTLIIILAGPLSNLIIGVTTLLLCSSNEYIRLFGEINILTALSNLIPIEGYDGYRLLCELGYSAGLFKINMQLKRLSFFFTSIITFLSLYLLMRVGVGYWVFAVFFTSLISKTVEDANPDKNVAFKRKREI